ncbi:MAG: alpha/beta fold hydrolase [Kofleriaceae bacterium]|nr:alpha/beta fold hydrolase [Kofleriaceae bacterium]MCB9574820.1 alpha/beta fold hydrolase [Kofleriaceae bacterium]
MAALRAALGVADRLSPRVAANLALRAFLSPPRPPRPAREVALLEVATPIPVVLDGQRVATWAWGGGDGPVVLLVHGWGGRGAQLGAVVSPLVNAGRTVVAFDAPAHGDTVGPATTLAAMARAVRAVADAVGPLDAVVAHSFGAAATTVAMARGLQARRVVYLAPMFRVSAAVERFVEAVGLSPVAAAAFRSQLASINQAGPDELDGPVLAPALTAALTVVHDRGDREVPFADGVAAAQAWPGARLVETAGLGHQRLLADPDVVEVVRDVVLGIAMPPARLDDAARIERDLLDRERRRARAFP